MGKSCPKCGTPKDGDACPRCGLVFAKFNPELLDQDVPEAIEALWRNVQERWDDRARHALFVERALAAGSLGYAARCYRAQGDDAVAEAQLRRIEERLQQVMAASQTGRPRRTSGRGVTLAILFLFLLVILGVISYGMHIISN
jgi:hypothetical protein